MVPDSSESGDAACGWVFSGGWATDGTGEEEGSSMRDGDTVRVLDVCGRVVAALTVKVLVGPESCGTEMVNTVPPSSLRCGVVLRSSRKKKTWLTGSTW